MPTRTCCTAWSARPTDLRCQILTTAGDQVKVTFPLELPFLRLRTVDGLPTMIAAFTTDIPKLTNWGEPLLIGPGSIHVAHTEGEYIEKQQLQEAIDLYCTIAKQPLLTRYCRSVISTRTGISFLTGMRQQGWRFDLEISERRRNGS